MSAGWAAHVVHHQSEEYNLTVALRQGALQPAFSWVFYLPLAVLGFPPAMFLAVSSFNTLYQFWIHTRLIGRLGPLEWVLNTPSHHRVHHARNPRYIDRNHGGTLIVWDRLFGTFARGAGRARLRHHAAARELEPGLGQPPLVGGDVGRGAAGAAAPRQGAGPLEAAGLAAGRPGRIRGPDARWTGDATSSTTCRCRGAWSSTCWRQFALVNLGAVAFLYASRRLSALPSRGSAAVGHRPEPGSAWAACSTGAPGRRPARGRPASLAAGARPLASS